MEAGILKYRIDDILRQSENHSRPQFLGFLTPEEQSEALLYLKQRGNFLLYGGYNDAERAFLGIFPEFITPDISAFPIKAITFKFREQDNLSHRDFLGSVLALGIKRETVGDILVESGRAVMFVNADICYFVLNNLRVVGRVGVTLQSGFAGELPNASIKAEVGVTVASLRLDCMVAAVCSVSRGTAEEMVESGRVSVNSVITERTTRQINTGDKVTVRGVGKFTLKEVGGTTKKGRMKIIIEKYV